MQAKGLVALFMFHTAFMSFGTTGGNEQDGEDEAELGVRQMVAIRSILALNCETEWLETGVSGVSDDRESSNARVAVLVAVFRTLSIVAKSETKETRDRDTSFSNETNRGLSLGAGGARAHARDAQR